MILHKDKILHNFNQAANTYEQVAQVQLASAKFLLKNLVAQLQLWGISKFTHVLDLGTGTGFVPKILIKNYSDLTIDLNDISINMLRMAENNIKSLAKYNLILGDLEEIPIKSYDLVTANLSLQWASDLIATLNKVYNNSKIFAFSCLLQGTFKEWVAKFNQYSDYFVVNNYPSKLELQRIVLSLGPQQFWYATKSFKIDFIDALAFMDYLKKLGANNVIKPIPYSYLKKVIKLQQPLETSYEVFFAILVRTN